MVATLGDIVSDIKSALVITTSDFDDNIKTAVRSAIRLQNKKRWWFLRETATLTVLGGESTASTPSNFSMPDKFVLIDGSYRRYDRNGFDYLEYNKFTRHFRTTSTVPSGTPIACALFNTTLHVSHAPTANTSIICDYYKKDVTLPTADSDMSVMFGDESYDLMRVLGQFIYEKEFLQSQPDPGVTLTYQKLLEQAHEQYEMGAY